MSSSKIRLFLLSTFWLFCIDFKPIVTGCAGILFQCFACGAEMGKHKRGHDYQLMVGHVIVDIMSFSHLG